MKNLITIAFIATIGVIMAGCQSFSIEASHATKSSIKETTNNTYKLSQYVENNIAKKGEHDPLLVITRDALEAELIKENSYRWAKTEGSIAVDLTFTHQHRREIGASFIPFFLTLGIFPYWGEQNIDSKVDITLILNNGEKIRGNGTTKFTAQGWCSGSPFAFFGTLGFISPAIPDSERMSGVTFSGDIPGYAEVEKQKPILLRALAKEINAQIDNLEAGVTPAEKTAPTKAPPPDDDEPQPIE